MNERIRELKDKLWTEEYWSNPNTDKLLSVQLEKFAELIVRDVLGVALYGDEFEQARANVKQHFGVEE